MVTDAARWRRQVVRPLLDWYAALDGVDAVMLGGSTARGDADRWSDVEVGVFWERPPTAAQRRAVPAEVRLLNVDGPPPWDDQVHLDGLMLEVAHTLSESVDNALNDLLAGRPDGATLQLAQGFVDSTDVTGRRPELVARWQERVATYPRDLAIAVVQHDGNIEKFWRLQMLIERENPLLISREFVRITGQFLTVLHALNGRYCGHILAFKRLDTMERDLPLAPPSLAARVRAVFTSPAATGAQILHDLVEETYDLVEHHLPEVDVNRLRTTFHNTRKPLDSAD
ncbi:nucleotidyltransferase domain-containing protein [Kribbella sp. NPDC051936]|uniref:nucleotidyltransferase domain-containing protein n=1 Tax=Kribbella sp. NPDC051936 TaxID=3154946 RepID=UPI00342E6CD7